MVGMIPVGGARAPVASRALLDGMSESLLATGTWHCTPAAASCASYIIYVI